MNAVVEVPEWVATLSRPRVPVGEVVSWCQWPIGWRLQLARPGDTFVSIAAQAYPLRCLACHSEHRIDELTDETDPSLKALKQLPCPTCGTVGLWPPHRPAQELKAANESLWESYGWDIALPEGEVLVVMQLCGREVLQRSPIGRQPTCCERPSPGADQKPHLSANVTKQLQAKLKEAAEELRAARAAGGVAVAEEAAVGASEGSAEAPASDPAGESVDDALAAIQTDIQVAQRLLGDATSRLARAAAKFDDLRAVIVEEQTDLRERCAKAEAESEESRGQADRIAAEAEQAVAAAEKARVRAEGHAETLAAELEKLKQGELEQLVVATLDRIGSRRGAAGGKRLTTQQREMMRAIGGGRVRVVRAVAEKVWYADGAPVKGGVSKTLDSLLQRGMIELAEERAGFAVAQLASDGAAYYRSVTGHDPEVAIGPGEQVEVKGDDTNATEVPEGWRPDDLAVQAQLRRVRNRQVTRGANRQWQYQGEVTPPRPAIQCLDWMLTHDVIGVGDDDLVYVVSEEDGP